MSSDNSKEKAWVVAVNMGYGHLRAAYPLKSIAVNQEIINANDYVGIPRRDRFIWEFTRRIYEFVSRHTERIFFGYSLFSLYNKFLKIPDFYNGTDKTHSNISLGRINSLISRGWGKDLVSRISEKSLPLITTLFGPAFMAEIHKYKFPIYCVITDTDITRAWASPDASKSNVKYFVPTNQAGLRLASYGVRKENIIYTGFPLPKENIGSTEMEILKLDLANRLVNLDPTGTYLNKYSFLVEKHLGALPTKSSHILTILFAVGGAGAQMDIALDAIKSLASKIESDDLKFIASLGIRESTKNIFQDKLKKNGVSKKVISSVEIIYSKDVFDYFAKFNLALRLTDILWTKPSELSFYSGLGLPILIAPPVGSQEDFNKEWLVGVGSGIPQKDPKYCLEWLYDDLYAGHFADAAMQGFIEVEKLGTYRIEEEIDRVSKE
jgi:hypothetical protein